MNNTRANARKQGIRDLYDESERLPSSQAAERALLGSLLTSDNPRLSDSVASSIEEDHFFWKSHADIYRVIRSLSVNNQNPDIVLVSQRLNDAGLLTDAMQNYIARIAMEAPVIPDVRSYAKEISEKFHARSVIFEARRIEKQALSGEASSAKDLITSARASMSGLANTIRDERQFRDPTSILSSTLDWITEAFESESGITGVPTGYPDLDSMTAGLHAGDLIILAGRPSMGKTALAMNIGESISRIGRGTVAVFSMEMPAEQLMARMVSSVSGVPYENLRSGNLNNDHWSRLTTAMTILSKSDIQIDDRPGLSPDEIRANLTDLVSTGKKLGLVVVDYLQLMQIPGIVRRHETVSEISRELKAIAREFGVPVIALSQLNRDLESRADKRPQNADLRDSGSIEQDADIIMFVYRDEYYNKDSPDKGFAELIVSKQRNGPTGTIVLAFNNKVTRFENVSNSDYDS